jgi:hypothetical protein
VGDDVDRDQAFDQRHFDLIVGMHFSEIDVGLVGGQRRLHAVLHLDHEVFVVDDFLDGRGLGAVGNQRGIDRVTGQRRRRERHGR